MDMHFHPEQPKVPQPPSMHIPENHGDRMANHLIKEKSPYLLQHAYNPVDWYPWGDEAFGKAKQENKPVFLSIGYSTCHWCHVMERESFEDEEVGVLMNEAFISIKVDREERTDIDHIYMDVCQMMTGSGGWPLTIIMTPDKKPFFAGTYLPKRSRYGRMGMVDLVKRIDELWKKSRQDVLESAEKITGALKDYADDLPRAELDETVLEAGYKQLRRIFDAKKGGFGSAPKFPIPHNHLFLLRYWRRSGDAKALEMVEKTLQEMRFGGIYDHLGYGFHRYSTDENWLVPHFEKMLYDQAMLAMAYIETFQATKNEAYANTGKEIFTYVLRDMTSPEGGFYSAEDADSEGEEGKFYVWTQKEIGQILGTEDARLFGMVYNLAANGNFREEATGKMIGMNILHLKTSMAKLAEEMQMSEEELAKKFKAAREKLFLEREKRIHPYKDDKILTDWNGLMIAALAKGASAFGEKSYAEAAERAVDFIFAKLQTKEGRLLHRYREGSAAIMANANDYAFLIWGLLELYGANFNISYLKNAIRLNDDFIEHFWDREKGGFYFTANDAEELLTKHKEIYDGAIPSGNSVAMLNLLRLARLTGNTELEAMAAKLGQVFSGNAKQSPAAYTQLLTAVDFTIGPSSEVVIVGQSDAKDTRELIDTIRQEFVPNKVVLFKAEENGNAEITEIAQFVKDNKMVDGKATAYVCENFSCQTPITESRKLIDILIKQW